MPSVEFSMGTTPYWNLPFSTSAKTSWMVVMGPKRVARPNFFRAARWEKVASGPRNATPKGIWTSRAAEMISRKMLRRAEGLKGPGFRCMRWARTSSSR